MPKKLTRGQKYYRAHKKEMNEKSRKYYKEHKERIREYFKEHRPPLEVSRDARRRSHLVNREKDLIGFKKHYQENKEYHRQKNKEHYEKNKEKWKDRRTEIYKDWMLAKASKYMVNGALEEVGISVEIDRDMTTFQMFALIEAFGISLEDCLGYAPFKSRYDRYADEYRQMKNSTDKV